MSTTVIYTIVSLSGLGAVAAIILYMAARKFKVYEDPRIGEVEDALPGANCGACGYPGCRAFAESVVKADDLSELYCPVGGNETMQKVAEIMGQEIEEKDPLVAVVRCAGSFENAPAITRYDGPASCTIENTLYGGETACHYGCLGKGDCVDACDFEAIFMNNQTGLPYVIDNNCTACGACVEACPRDIIELRKRNKKDRKIYVSCVNQDKGGVARKACKVACIGCGKCVKVCPFDAITLENNLAYIDPNKCKLCRKCVPECPTNAILEVGFPPRKKKNKEQSEPVQSESKKENKNID
ncbi:MAG: Fe-S cluster domain-containing protein [Bacteroidales bacterium]|nr:Fe-S cluster domain-containing protein [Bacteroidales bacterium]MBS3774993.1 Fe-S cluster domain-containing protein [Bacteroidales bacterium]